MGNCKKYWDKLTENLRGCISRKTCEIQQLTVSKKKGWKKVNYWIMLCCTEKLAGGSQKHAFMTSDASTSILLSGSIPSIVSIHVYRRSNKVYLLIPY